MLDNQNNVVISKNKSRTKSEEGSKKIYASFYISIPFDLNPHNISICGLYRSAVRFYLEMEFALEYHA